jgi:hypothetical protein
VPEWKAKPNPGPRRFASFGAPLAPLAQGSDNADFVSTQYPEIIRRKMLKFDV